MTILVGVACQDGVVIGSDSTATFNAGRIRTIEQPAIKLEVIGERIITATTGSVGLAQRFNGTVQKLANGGKLSGFSEVDIGVLVAEAAIADFQRTPSVLHNHPEHGWGVGALMAMEVAGKPQLFEFDPVQFSPEIKGFRSDKRGDRISRIVSMGSGQLIADPFLGFVRSLFWTEQDPSVQEGKLAVYWTLRQAINLNTGGIGGDPQIAVLRRENRDWKARVLERDDLGEVRQQVDELETHIRSYRSKLNNGPIPPKPAP